MRAVAVPPRRRGSRAAHSLVALLTVALCTLLPGRGGAASEAAVDEEVARALAAKLRCVVCQNLSVADSPSEMAGQMRDLIRARLAQGDSPDQVVQYFVERYGEWVLLSPRFGGFTLTVWVLPFVLLSLGLCLVVVLARHWSRRGAAQMHPGKTATLSPEDRERLQDELERLPR